MASALSIVTILVAALPATALAQGEDARAYLELRDQVLKRPPAEIVTAGEAFLQAHPKSAFAPAVRKRLDLIAAHPDDAEQAYRLHSSVETLSPEDQRSAYEAFLQDFPEHPFHADVQKLLDALTARPTPPPQPPQAPPAKAATPTPPPPPKPKPTGPRYIPDLAGQHAAMSPHNVGKGETTLGVTEVALGRLGYGVSDRVEIGLTSALAPVFLLGDATVQVVEGPFNLAVRGYLGTPFFVLSGLYGGGVAAGVGRGATSVQAQATLLVFGKHFDSGLIHFSGGPQLRLTDDVRLMVQATGFIVREHNDPNDGIVGPALSVRWAADESVVIDLGLFATYIYNDGDLQFSETVPLLPLLSMVAVL